jgi:hypothetical protein
VIIVKDNMVTANRGSNFGINPGDVNNIFRVGEPVKDPDTGKIIGKQETFIGKATVDTVQLELCTLILTGVKGNVKPGDILRPATDPYEKLKEMDRF